MNSGKGAANTLHKMPLCEFDTYKLQFKNQFIKIY